MKKLALASAILLAVTGSAIAATQTTDTTAKIMHKVRYKLYKTRQKPVLMTAQTKHKITP